MQERKTEIRTATLFRNGEVIMGQVIDNEHYHEGVGRSPNHDKIVIVYEDREKEEKE